VSDVGSVKVQVVTDMAAHLPDHVHFVPTHPVAGTEYSGPDAGFAEPFVGRWYILTPDGTDGRQAAVRRRFAPRSGWALRPKKTGDHCGRSS
jgi:cyclohexadieny/prephenate dehydrogenase